MSVTSGAAPARARPWPGSGGSCPHASTRDTARYTSRKSTSAEDRSPAQVLHTSSGTRQGWRRLTDEDPRRARLARRELPDRAAVIGNRSPGLAGARVVAKAARSRVPLGHAGETLAGRRALRRREVGAAGLADRG